HRGDYVEIDVKYERIQLPPRYKPTPRTQLKVVTDATLSNTVHRYSRIYGLNESLIYAVIRAESNFDPNAVSSAGARGLMQLMPGTAAEMGVTDIFDPVQNVAGGTQYLSKMLELFKNKKFAIAAYNAGPENVKKHKGIPPFKETQHYVKTVLSYEKAYKAGAASPNFHLQTNGKPMRPRVQPTKKKQENTYIVHFHSGLTQPANSVEDREPYWYIGYGNRTYPVRKTLVKSIEEKG
ncbi:MAG: lytic transglycosylase domain-containing protein, partial [Candidatus Hydrogenedentes bacterium]|nr:lytic transglycosylase domain-containing protein [Candidatus Hydrogenedentota bacterium]